MAMEELRPSRPQGDGPRRGGWAGKLALIVSLLALAVSCGVLYLVLYIVSLIPLVTGLDIEGVIGNTMIPTMILNVIMNLYCLKLPAQYPEQWEKRGLRYPKWVWNLCSVAGSVFAIMVIYNLFINLDAKAAAMVVGELVIMFLIPFITLKMKWVSPERLAAHKQEVIHQALRETTAEQ